MIQTEKKQAHTLAAAPAGPKSGVHLSAPHPDRPASSACRSGSSCRSTVGRRERMQGRKKRPRGMPPLAGARQLRCLRARGLPQIACSPPRSHGTRGPTARAGSARSGGDGACDRPWVALSLPLALAEGLPQPGTNRWTTARTKITWIICGSAADHLSPADNIN